MISSVREFKADKIEILTCVILWFVSFNSDFCTKLVSNVTVWHTKLFFSSSSPLGVYGAQVQQHHRNCESFLEILIFVTIWRKKKRTWTGNSTPANHYISTFSFYATSVIQIYLAVMVTIAFVLQCILYGPCEHALSWSLPLDHLSQCFHWLVLVLAASSQELSVASVPGDIQRQCSRESAHSWLL